MSMKPQTTSVTLTKDAVPLLRQAAAEMKQMSEGRTRSDAAKIVQEYTAAAVAGAVSGKDHDVFPVPEVFNDFVDAPTIEGIATMLIEQHEQFADLRPGALPDGDITVRYMWKKKGGTKSGRATLGYCQKLSGLNRVLADGADYLIWVATDNARASRLTYRQMEALVYHELLHVNIVKDEDEEGEVTVTTKVRGHDAELFVDELREYGAWKLDLRNVSDTIRQLKLWDEAAD